MTDITTTVHGANEDMEPLGNTPFPFRCHPDVSCYTVCCQKVDLQLYPYDVLRLKRALGVDSEEFMRRYARLVQGDNPFFPTVMLVLDDDGKGNCPFLVEAGCSIYEHRPTSCRTYPLARGVLRTPDSSQLQEHYFLVRHDYCKGHHEDQQVTARQYIRSQKVDEFNLYNDLWAELDALFRTNPWAGEGSGGPKQQLAFMVCYNIDGFRRFAEEHRLIEQFRIAKDRRRALGVREEEWLKFGFEWLTHVLTGRSSLQPR